MMPASSPLLHARSLVTGYRSGGHVRAVAGPLTVSLYAGQLVCLLGPNGSGKSTLLRTLAGLQSPMSGQLEIEEGREGKLSPAQLARKISLVLTDPVRSSNLTVHSLVALGRYPYSGWLGILNDEDRKVIEDAIAITGIAGYRNRKMSTLSDGESQKVMLARALAQDTPIMMLDEPTAHLDLPSRIQLMRLLHKLARQTGKGILLTTHELDLALQVADEIWLLQPGGQLTRGAPEDLVLDGTFEKVFEREGIRFDKYTGAFLLHEEHARKVLLRGRGMTAFWTKRALRRLGFSVITPAVGDDDAIVGSEKKSISVSILEGEAGITWLLAQGDRSRSFDRLAALLHALRESAI